MNDKKKLRDIVNAIEAIEAYSVSSYDEFLAELLNQARTDRSTALLVLPTLSRLAHCL